LEKDHLRAFTHDPGVNTIYHHTDDIKNKLFDVVIDATGGVRVMKRTIDFTRPGGQVLLFGVPPMGEKLELDVFQIFRKGLTISSSFTSVRNSLQALSVLSSGLINVEDLITHRLPWKNLKKVLLSLMTKRN
jgi:threonine dehydrogenase-like Zn-dependent dehydrogenase